MEKEIFKKVLVTLFLVVNQIIAADGVHIGLSSSKSLILLYEPIYLKMELMKPENCKHCIFESLELGKIQLEITPPSGKPFTYSPPIKACVLHPDTAVKYTIIYETVILSGNEIVTSAPGTLLLKLKIPSGETISNTLAIQIRKSDLLLSKELQTEITQNAVSYGLYVYFGGGDHLVEGSKVVHSLANLESDYGIWARPILANNYVSASYDWSAQKVRRNADLNLVRKLADLGDQRISENIRLNIAESLVNEYGSEKLDADFKVKITSLKQTLPGNKSKEFERLSGIQ